jgi:hypothetical protein
MISDQREGRAVGHGQPSLRTDPSASFAPIAALPANSIWAPRSNLSRPFMASPVHGRVNRKQPFTPPPAHANSSSSAFAALRSGVSKPSVNQP